MRKVLLFASVLGALALSASASFAQEPTKPGMTRPPHRVPHHTPHHPAHNRANHHMNVHS